MKRIITIFTVLISFFVFNISFEQYAFKDYVTKRDLAYLLTENQAYKTISYEFDFGNNKDNFTKEITAFLKENRATAFFSEEANVTTFNKQTNYYLFYEGDSLYPIKENKQLDFTKYNQNYYTSDLSDKNSNYHINYLNNKYNSSSYNIINIYAFDNLKNSVTFKNESKVVVHFFVTDIDQLKDNLMSSNLAQYTDINNPIILDVNHDENLDVSDSIKILIVIALALLVLSICDILRNKNAIILKKLLGNSVLEIYHSLFLKRLALVYILYDLSQIIFFFIFVGRIYSSSVNFLMVLGKYCILLLILLIIISIIIIIFIRYFVSVLDLKRTKENRYLIVANVILKVVALVILIQPVTVNVGSMINNLKLQHLLIKDSERFKNNYYLYGIKTDETASRKAMEMVVTYFDNHSGYYQNFEINEYEKDPVLADMIGNYPYDYLEANQQYLNEYHLKDASNNLIDFEKLRNYTLLVPMEYKDKDISMYNGSDIVYIKNDYIFERRTLKQDYSVYYLKNPIIKYYKKIPIDTFGNSNFKTVINLSNKKDLIKFRKFLVKNNLNNGKTVFYNSSDDYKSILEYTISNIKTEAFMAIIFILTIIIFLYETLFFIILQGKKKYAVYYIMGYSYLERYGNLYLLNMFTDGLLLVIGIILKVNIIPLLNYVLAILAFESILLYLLIGKFEKISIANNLKGEDL